MPPPAPPPETLQVTHRNTLFKIPTSSIPTLAALRAHLQTLTHVPPDRQKLLSRSLRRPLPADPQTPLLANFTNNTLPHRPILLLGTPHQPEPLTPPPEQPDVKNDLHELVESPPRITHSPPQPASPPSPLPPSPLPPPAPARPPAEAATPSQENLHALLLPAAAGPALLERRLPPDHPPSPWVPEAAFADALTAAKRAQRMLAILLFDFGPAAAPASHAFLRATAAPAALLSDTLAASFTVLPADISALPDPSPLLRALGLDAVPAVAVFAHVGASMALVDLFNVGFVGDAATAAGASALATRLHDTLARFNDMYETDRARRVAADDRVDLIREQDAAMQEASRGDREREEARQREEVAAREAAERERREAEQAQREREAEQARVEMEAKSAREALPPEPAVDSVAARVAVRLPDGRRVERRFLNSAPVSEIFTFCVSQGLRRGSFALVTGFPRRMVTEQVDGMVSVESAGFAPSVSLNVDLV